MGQREAEIADVVQETFLQAARFARQYDGRRGSLWMWLCGIARNQVALHFRKQTRRDRLYFDGAHAAIAGRLLAWMENRHKSPEVELESVETASLVRAALTELPADYEVLLVAKYIDDVSVEQLAEDERMSPTAIRSKLARARQAFRDVFAKSTVVSSRNEERIR
jgi:RNA polymerase sigma-70 factor (ECF subfamily)